MKAGKNIALLGRPGYGKTLAALLCGIRLKNDGIEVNFTGTTGMAATNYAHFNAKTFHSYFLGGTFEGTKGKTFHIRRKQLNLLKKI
jgi:DNA replication protein DnaC